MDKAITLDRSNTSKKQVSWSKNVTNEDGSSVRTRVESLKKGFLVTVDTEGKDSEGNYQYNTEKEFSETNPFEEDTEEKELSLLDSLAKLMK